MLPDRVLDEEVAHRVCRVGHTFGRRSMHGLLCAEGILCSQRRVGESLRRNIPASLNRRRQDLQRMINPIPYTAR